MSEITTSSVTLSVEGAGDMPCYVAKPAGGGPGKGILVFQEAWGVNGHIRDVTERFAREGFIAVAPALFHRTDPNFDDDSYDFSKVGAHFGAVTTEGLIADAAAAHAWLVSADGGAAKSTAAIGYCLGGKTAFLANATLPLKAAVSYYGGGIPTLLDRVPALAAPQMLMWGGRDAHLGPEGRRATADALTEAGKTFVETVFSNADHGFFCDARAAYQPQAAKQSWALTLAFLADYV